MAFPSRLSSPPASRPGHTAPELVSPAPPSGTELNDGNVSGTPGAGEALIGASRLADLLAKAHAELASREKENRKELRAELERRPTAAGYKVSDIFPELGGTSSSTRRTRPAKYRRPAEPRPDLERHRTESKMGTGDPR